MNPSTLWAFFPVGYLFTIAIETPILLFGLSPRHTLRERFFAGIWLTACTYPIVVLVMPLLFPDSRYVYLAVAETFAPVAECVLFRIAFGSEASWRDYGAIVAANLASFLLGELFWASA